MATLPLTDSQIKDLSKDTCALPILISGTDGYEDQRARAIVNKGIDQLDDDNKSVLSDAWELTVQSYHAEIHELDGTDNTDYDHADLLAGGKFLPPHHAVWSNTTPKLLDSNNGLPSVVDTNDFESDVLLEITKYHDLLKTGFSDGAGNEISSAVIGGLITVPDSSGFSIGNNAIFDQVGDSGYIEITDIDNPAVGDIAYTLIGGSDPTAVGSGGTLRNSHAGFNNSERGHQSTNYASVVQVYFEAELDLAVVDWRTTLLAQSSALAGNTDFDGTSRTQNDAADVSATGLKDDLIIWESVPVIDVAGRYTDTLIATLSGGVTNRNAILAVRPTEIIASLGNVSQAGDGSFSGAGAYFSSFLNINIRVNMTSGSLTRLGLDDEAIKHWNEQIDNANNQLAQNLNIFAIAKTLDDTEVSQIDFTVDDVAEFSIGQTVKVMDNNSMVYTRTIDDINGTTISLNSGIPVALAFTAFARIVRQKV